MKDFIDVHSWFEQRYQEKSSSGYPTFKIALNVFLQHQGSIILETGTARLAMAWEDWGDGYSTPGSRPCSSSPYQFT